MPASILGAALNPEIADALPVGSVRDWLAPSRHTHKPYCRCVLAKTESLKRFYCQIVSSVKDHRYWSPFPFVLQSLRKLSAVHGPEIWGSERMHEGIKIPM